MDLRESQDAGLSLLHLIGEIDLDSSPELREVLRTHLDRQTPVLILDFTEVEYMDSSGLATLVEYVKHAGDFDGQFAVAGLCDSLRAIFELAHLDALMPRYPTPGEACAAFR